MLDRFPGGYEEGSISILARLHAGDVGEDFIGLLRTVMGSQLKRLPGPEGQGLTDDDVDDEVHSFYVERWGRTIAALLAEATDDESMTRLSMIGAVKETETSGAERGSDASGHSDRVPASGRCPGLVRPGRRRERLV